jgi:hypothetical protein
MFVLCTRRSVLLVEETGIPGENHRPVASHWQTLSHNIVASTPRLSGIRTHNYSGDMYWLHRLHSSRQHYPTILHYLKQIISPWSNQIYYNYRYFSSEESQKPRTCTDYFWVEKRFVTGIYYLLGPSWSWSYGSWMYNYLCNQYISPL